MTQYGDESFLRVRGVNVKFNNLQILQNINLTAKTGNVLAILGPSGSGKTTILNFISGRLKVVPGRQTVVSGQATVNDVHSTSNYGGALVMFYKMMCYFLISPFGKLSISQP